MFGDILKYYYYNFKQLAYFIKFPSDLTEGSGQVKPCACANVILSMTCQ